MAFWAAASAMPGMSIDAIAAGPDWSQATCAAAAVTGLTSRARMAIRARTKRIKVTLYLGTAGFNTRRGA